MEPSKSNLFNSIVLIVIGFWGAFPYLFMNNGSATSMIPLILGFVLLMLNKGLQNHNKVIAHIVVGLTFLILFALFMPLKGALERSDTMAIFRLILMMLSSFVAIITFVKSFIEARKKS